MTTDDPGTRDRKEATRDQPEGGAAPDPVAEFALVVEALLFSAEEPVPASKLAEIGGMEIGRVRDAVTALNRVYEDSGRTFRIHRVAQGFQLYTLPDFAQPVRQLYRRQLIQRLSRAALEVLAIIAYRQPVTRPQVEEFRGVDCSGPIVTLLERRLIATAGKARRPGSPYLYRTTREFLRYFGLESLDDLPPLEELGAFLAGALEEQDRQLEITTSEQLAIGDERIVEAARADEEALESNDAPPATDAGEAEEPK
ncbi:MAG TPA: SMC-Scp complex subunit ScpB [candidate division WOR-3 bacterium]|uniref:SMC-Scp complex subunit ScpB n=1 Tax=candidate division WOR-3 bacterium TaxID=2052148 RepID=A0A7V0T5Y5_UNCW3|nr:SMC-Scp complex subunit ScpB [candidate division WOR-3 bacterium]